MYEIAASALLKEVMNNYFRDLKSRSKPLAWCTSVGPAELLRSFGFEVYFPENHGALLGATRKAMDYIPVASKIGYPSDICSYLTSDIGSHIQKSTPLTKHYGLDAQPIPDLIVYNTNQCREVQDWFSYFADQYKCPILGIVPPRHMDEVKQADIDNVSSQFKSLIPECERVSGNKFDIDQFRETLRLSKEATLLWKKTLETSIQTPAPISFFDATIHMGPIVVLRGTETAKAYYKVLSDELEVNVKNKVGFLPKETSRIYWEGMPIWGRLRFLSDLFAQHHSAVVASTYCNSWIFDDFDERTPFESSALAYTKIFINRSERAKLAILKDLINDFRITGVIFHEAKTCFNNSNSRFGMPAKLKEETGVETLIIEGDLCDLRFFSEEQSTIKIETLLEQISS